MIEPSDIERDLGELYERRHRALSHAGAWGFVTLALGAASAFLAIQEVVEGDLGARAAVDGFRWLAIGTLALFGAALLLSWRSGQSLAGELAFQLDCAILLLVSGMGSTVAFLTSFPRVTVTVESAAIVGAFCAGALICRTLVVGWAGRIQDRSESEAELLREDLPRRARTARALSMAA